MKTSEGVSKLRAAGITNRLIRRVSMKMQLDDLQAFVWSVERGFKSQLAASEQKWKQLPKDLSDDELETYLNRLSHECFSLDSAFPDLVRQTSFTYLYSVLEKGLMFLCESAYRHGLHEAPADHKGKGIRKAISYLKKTAKIKVPEGRDWCALCLLGDLRNRFVHSISRKPLQPALDAYVKRNPTYFRIGASGQIILREGFCEHAVELVRRFYLEVLEAIPDELLE